MARQEWVVLFQLALLSSFLKAGSCDFKPINLKPPAVECNMSSVFSDSYFGTSLNCTGALNGNRNTAWITSSSAGANCVYTKKQPNQYWLVNLLQSRNIHRITIYPEKLYMGNTVVKVDGREVYKFPNSVTTVTYITSNNSTNNRLPVRGQIILLTRGALNYSTLCELEADECSSNTFGPVCSDNCSRHCQANGAGTTCDSITGNCIIGCEDGWWGGRCDRECPRGCEGPCNRTTGLCSLCKNFVSPNCTGCSANRWGTDCSKECGNCAGDGSCEMNTGECTTGCFDEYQGFNCTQAVTAPPEEPRDIAPLVGGVAAAVVVIVVVVVVVIVVRRRKQGKGGRADDDRRSLQSSSNQLLNVTNSDALKRNKPQPRPKPSQIGEPQPKAKLTMNPDVHIYSNTGAVESITSSANDAMNPPTAAKSQGAQAGKEASGKPAVATKPSVPKDKPSTTCSDTPSGLKGRVYENVPAPDAHKSRALAESANARPQSRSDDLAEVDDEDYYNSEDIYSSPLSVTSTLLDDFQRYLIRCLASGMLIVQFEDLPKGMKHPHKVGMTGENSRKNRFKALCAYDYNRVVLHRPKGDKSSDYINATYIKGCQRDKQYIATQGPRNNTVDDLWYMVWQEGITQIVMLCNLKEDGKDKCEEYWPAPKASKSCGHVTVTGLEEEPRADFFIRTFTLKSGNSPPRHVTQYHYHAWPDHGVPQAASLVDFWRYVKGRNFKPDVPLLVHCSAGVGRTGTFIALDIASDLESRGRDVNINDIVTQLREERCLMVQSEAQYKFLHEAVLEAHTSRATRVPVSKFDDIFQNTVDMNKESARIDREFQILQHMGQFAPKSTHTMAELPENLDKNRNLSALPDDTHIVYLDHMRGRNQYINAVYLPSFRNRRGFVLTQLPIPSKTLVDFWRLVHECGVNTIVSIGSAEEEKKVKDYCRYWLRGTGEVLTANPYTVTTKSSKHQGSSLISYQLTVQSKTEEKLQRNVELFHYMDWAGEAPRDSSSLLRLLNTLTNSKTKTQPVLVQCIDGAAKSGLFCVLYDVITRVTCDEEVEIYLTARQLQRVRPQALQTKTDYRFLYKAVHEYILSHAAVYANAGVR